MLGKSQKFVSDVGVTFVATASQTALAFVITVILGKWIGAEELGLYRMAITIYGIIILLAAIGIPSAIIKYVAEFRDNKDKINELVSCSIITVLFSGIVFSALFFSLSGTIAGAFKMSRLQELIKILSPVFLFALINSTLLGLLNGYREMKKYATVIIVRSVLTIVITAILVYYNFGAKGAVTGLVLSEILSCFFLIWISRNYFKLVFNNFFPTVGGLSKFGVQILGADAINTLNKQLDIILIGLFLLPSDVGYYAAAVSLSRFFWLIPSSIQKITYPATSEYWSKQNHTALNNMINKSIKYSSLILVFIGLGVFFFGNYIMVSLFREDFTISFVPLQILLIGTVIRGGIAQPIGASLTGIGRADLIFKLTAFMLIINVLFDLLLIPRIGIIGAAIATSISLSTGALINLVLIVKNMSVKIDGRWFLKLLGIAIASIALFKIGIHFINPYLLGSILLGSCLFFMLTLLLTKEDRIALKSLPSLFLARKYV